MTYNETINNISKGLKIFADNCLCEITFDTHIVIIDEIDRELNNNTIIDLCELGWKFKERGLITSGYYFNAWVFDIKSYKYFIQSQEIIKID